MKLDIYRVRKKDGDESLDDVYAIGVRLPSGRCYLEWNTGAFPPEKRLKDPHVSEYGRLEDITVAVDDATIEKVLSVPTGWER